MPVVQLRRADQDSQRPDGQADVGVDVNRPDAAEGDEPENAGKWIAQDKGRQVDQADRINGVDGMFAMSGQPVEVLRADDESRGSARENRPCAAGDGPSKSRHIPCRKDPASAFRGRRQDRLAQFPSGQVVHSRRLASQRRSEDRSSAAFAAENLQVLQQAGRCARGDVNASESQRVRTAAIFPIQRRVCII